MSSGLWAHGRAFATSTIRIAQRETIISLHLNATSEGAVVRCTRARMRSVGSPSRHQGQIAGGITQNELKPRRIVASSDSTSEESVKGQTLNQHRIRQLEARLAAGNPVRQA